jgi:hypothetical protein
MKAYGGVDVQIHIFLASALAEGEWSASRPDPFTPRERAPSAHCIGGSVDPRAGLDDVERRTFLTLPGLEPRSLGPFLIFFFNLYSGEVESRSTRHCGHQWPIVSVPGDYDDGEIGGMIGKGNRSTRRKPAAVPLCPPQTPHVARTRTRAAAVGSQRLTA